jgi:beta-glucuronidase
LEVVILIRLFNTHKIRQQIELEGMWNFEAINEHCIPENYSYTLPVPSCWEQHPDFLTYRGLGAYKRTINVAKDCNLRFEFKGVSHTADVYFDGKFVSHHYNAFTPFSVVIPNVSAGEHALELIVDNTFSQASALHLPNDYYTYGGIIRPVAMESVSAAYIERLEFTSFISMGKWNASIKVILNNISTSVQDVKIKASLNGYDLDFGKTFIEAGKSVSLESTFAFDNVTPWSSETPTLYLLETKLFLKGNSVPVDDLIERVGFRTIELKNRKMLVNGNEIFMKGFCRHEDHALVGCAIPLQLMVKDIEILKSSSANAVRTSHYPNDERFLDLCDENGIFVWEENHARGLILKDMLNPNFNSQCETCNSEMVYNNFNHPSIVIWGILNECATETLEGREMYKTQLEQIRSLDKSRPLSFATCRHFIDICLDLADIISINLYSGWYDEEDSYDFYMKTLKWADENGGANKPVIISEFGAAAIYGLREPSHVKWSEERQCDILDACLNVYMNRPEITGTFIWQFADCRVTEDGDWFRTRAGCRNNKGILDGYRRPKLAFETVKKYYKKK